MENNNNPKILVTDGYKVEHKKMIDKLILNSILPTNSAPYLFIIDDFGERGARVAEEAYIQTRALQTIADNLIVASHGREKFLHHELPTVMPPIGFIHDFLEDRIGDYPKLSEKIIEKTLELSNIIVSLQSNNQKD